MMADPVSLSIECLLRSIVGVKRASEGAKRNKQQCHRINAEWAIVHDAIVKARAENRVGGSQCSSLDALAELAEETGTYLEKFGTKSYMSKMYSHTSDSRRFADLLDSLHTLIGSLNLDLTAETARVTAQLADDYAADMLELEQQISDAATERRELADQAAAKRQKHAETQAAQGQELAGQAAEERRRMADQLAAAEKRSQEDMKKMMAALAEIRVHNQSIKPPPSPSSATLPQRPVTQIPESDLEKHELIGEGAFGKVHRGAYIGAPVAIKTLPVGAVSPAQAEDLLKEAGIHQSLAHPNVIKFYGVVMGSVPMIVMELATCSLKSLLHSGEPLTMQTRAAFVTDIGKGVLYMHKHNVFHRDLKADNVPLFGGLCERVFLFLHAGAW